MPGDSEHSSAQSPGYPADSLSCAGESLVSPSAGSGDPSLEANQGGSNIQEITAKNSLRQLRKQCSIQYNG